MVSKRPAFGEHDNFFFDEFRGAVRLLLIVFVWVGFIRLSASRSPPTAPFFFPSIPLSFSYFFPFSISFLNCLSEKGEFLDQSCRFYCSACSVMSSVFCINYVCPIGV